MKIVVDSNVLFTFFWMDSTFSKLCESTELQLITPEYALEEINNHKEEITKKAKISEKEFNKRKLELFNRINFLHLSYYVSEFESIKNLSKKFEEEKEEILKDIDFLALALKLNIPLWTQDKLLKKQNIIKILTTKEIIEIL